ncbi:hypothetical protein [Anaplasma phagocytophilum]|uniref:hypothetical protein n=1 Tax=Anaplasma phagocytophilum TaxID=948 RepID=UPI0012DABA05|nr:hypothetical protein [Anaplasma phagocytophilum]
MLRCIALQYGCKARGCCWPESFEKVIYRFFVPGLRVIFVGGMRTQLLVVVSVSCG